MQTIKLHMDGENQVILLPKEFHLPGTEVYIKKSEATVTLISKRDCEWANSEEGWKAFLEALNGFSDDFMADYEAERRNQNELQER